MDPQSNPFRAALQTLRERRTSEELESYVSTTLEDVQRTVARIQSRQDIERTLMDWTRVQPFLDKMTALHTTIHTLPDAVTYMAVVWGLLKAICAATSQDQKALDILLDAFEEVGNAIPILEEQQGLFHLHPALWKVLELIYQEVLQFLEHILRLSTHPNMRTLFKSMWNDYAPKFRTMLNKMRAQTTLMSHVRLMSTIPTQVNQPVTLNIYENVNINGGNAHLGDTYYDTQQLNAERHQVLTQLQALEHNLAETNRQFEAQEKIRCDERLMEIHKWIAAPVAYNHHERALKVHRDYPSTGLWILQNAVVAAWMKDDLPRNPILWVHGIPGAGKTILASVLIEACEGVENSHTAYFYCKFDDPETHSTMGILNGLLAQAVKWRPDLTAYFDEQRRQSGEPTVSRESTAKKLTELVARGGGRTYIVVDGIDECPLDDRKSTLSFLSSLVRDVDTKDPGMLRLLVVSQNEPDIRRAMSGPAELQIRKSLNAVDIEMFLAQNLQPLVELRLAPDEIELLQQRICSYAAGQFLYAKLVMEHLCASNTLMELRQELQNSEFPKELREAYERIIRRVKRQLRPNQWKVTQQLLGWMTCAARPLKWHEIQGALSIELKWHEMQGALSLDLDNCKVDFKERSLSKDIQDYCGALVTVHNDRVSLVHVTAHEFIEKSEHIDHPLVECQLANLCIGYLSLPWFDPSLTPIEIREYVVEGYYAFADYATAKWIHHLYRVAQQAVQLTERDRWEDREVHVKEFLATVQEFYQSFQDDLQSIQLDAHSQPDLFKLLRSSSTDEARTALQSLWQHAEAYRSGGPQVKHIITLQTLSTAMEQIRNVLEEIHSAKSLPDTERAELVSFYGDRPYRCSKTSCFFFHEGFENADNRNKHVARHDRVYQCPEPDCATADFDFADLKALRAHVLDKHQNSEMWEKMFKPLIVKESKTDTKSKFRCEPCDLSFSRNSILKDHQRAHAGQKEYECSKCTKAFVRKWDCTRHERTHETRIRRP